MSKYILATFFSLLFLGLLISPTISMCFNDTIDMSCVYDILEEEEEKGNETIKDLETYITEFTSDNKSFETSHNLKHPIYTFKVYVGPNLYLVSPPPEYIS